MIEALRGALEADPIVAYALLFGSHARSSGRADSDVDVAVGLTRGADAPPVSGERDALLQGDEQVEDDDLARGAIASEDVGIPTRRSFATSASAA